MSVAALALRLQRFVRAKQFLHSTIFLQDLASYETDLVKYEPDGSVDWMKFLERYEVVVDGRWQKQFHMVSWAAGLLRGPEDDRRGSEACAPIKW